MTKLMASVVVLSLLCGCSKSVSDAYKDSENAQRDAAEAWAPFAASIKQSVDATRERRIEELDAGAEKELRERFEDSWEEAYHWTGIRDKWIASIDDPWREAEKVVEFFLQAATAAAMAAKDPSARTIADLSAQQASDHADIFMRNRASFWDAGAAKAVRLAKAAAEAARMARN